MTRRPLLLVALLVAVTVGGAAAATVGSNRDDTTGPRPDDETAIDELLQEHSEVIEPCVRELGDAVARVVDGTLGPDPDAALNQVMLEFGYQSKRAEQILAIYPEVFREQVNHGVDAAVDLLRQRVVDACTLERGTTDAVRVDQLPAVTTSMATTTTTGAPVPETTDATIEGCAQHGCGRDDNGIDLVRLRTEIAASIESHGGPPVPVEAITCSGESTLPHHVPPGGSFSCIHTPTDVRGELIAVLVTVTGHGTYTWEYIDA